MSSLISLYLKKETLKTLLDTVEKKGGKGVELTISLNDETNQYGQNVAAYVAQTKGQREEKKERFYVGNGKVFWTNGTVSLPTSNDPEEQGADISGTDTDDLPF